MTTVTMTVITAITTTITIRATTTSMNIMKITETITATVIMTIMTRIIMTATTITARMITMTIMPMMIMPMRIMATNTTKTEETTKIAGDFIAVLQQEAILQEETEEAILTSQNIQEISTDDSHLQQEVHRIMVHHKEIQVAVIPPEETPAGPHLTETVPAEVLLHIEAAEAISTNLNIQEISTEDLPIPKEVHREETREEAHQVGLILILRRAEVPLAEVILQAATTEEEHRKDIRFTVINTLQVPEEVSQVQDAVASVAEAAAQEVEVNLVTAVRIVRETIKHPIKRLAA